MSETLEVDYPAEKRESRQLEVKFFFSSHDTPEDLKKLPELLADADIYIPERPLSSPRDIYILNALSHGEIQLPKSDKESIEDFELRVIGSSMKMISHVDVPARHPLAAEFKSTLTEEKKIDISFASGKFDEAIKLSRENISHWVRLNQEREQLIISRLKAELYAIENKFPWLKNKKKLKILVFLGSGHTPVYHKIKQEPSVRVTREHGSKNIVFSTSTELIRRGAQGEDIAALGDEWYGRIIIEHFLNNLLREVSKDTNTVGLIAKKIGKRLSLEDMRELSIAFNERELSQQDFLDIINEKLRESGLGIPTTEQEVDKFVRPELSN